MTSKARMTPAKDGVDLLAVAGRNVMRGVVWGALVAGLTQSAISPSPAQANVGSPCQQVASGVLRGKNAQAGEPGDAADGVQVEPRSAGAEDPGTGPGMEDGSGEDAGEPQDAGDDGANPTQEPEDLSAPTIEISWGGAALEEGALLGEPARLDIVVTEQNPALDEAGLPAYEATLTHMGGGQTVGLPAWELQEDPCVQRLTLDAGNESVRLADGSYVLEVRCADASGNAAMQTRRFCLDTSAPVIGVRACEGSDVRLLPNGRAYVKGPLALEVEVSDWSFNPDETLVMGAPLEGGANGGSSGTTLPDGVACGPWTQSSGDAGMPTYAATLCLDEGTYDLTDLVCACDGLGRTTRQGLSLPEGDVGVVVVDGTAPQVRIEGIGEGAFTCEDVVLQVRVTDKNLGALATLDPSRSLAVLTRDGEVVGRVTVGYEGAETQDEEHAYEVRVPADPAHESDGRYELEARLEDLSGNTSELAKRSFVVDTTAPQLYVTFEAEDDEASGGPYFRTARTAHIVLRDDMMALQDLASEDSPIRVEVTASLGHSADKVDLGTWHGAGEHAFACDVRFPTNGTYELLVAGTDLAGNSLVGIEGTEVDATGAYRSGRFVLDDEAPEVTVSYAQGTPSPATYGGIDYFCRTTTLVVEVSDRNLDLAQCVVENTRGEDVVPTWREVRRSDDGVVVHVAEMSYLEEGGARKSPRVHAVDLAGNDTVLRVPTFVVDQTAPSIRLVRASRHPSEALAEGVAEDPVYYYDAGDGSAPTLTFSLFDECGIARAWLDDPDGVYDIEASDILGKTEDVIVARLKDQEGERRDTEFGRDMRLRVRDLAGNVREWTLDRTGRVVTDRALPAPNASIDDGGVFPQALIWDATSPRVEVSGVEEGAYYPSAQVARIEVYERLFSHVRRLDAQRVVATVERRDPTPEGRRTSWTVRASQLEGEDPLYALDQPLASDGHYTIVAGFADVAGNPSNVVRVGEFTVDTLAPAIEVTWNNDDVRNGLYYQEGRVATVRVLEHNFSADLVSIRTTGSVGAWRTEGDTHTCEVSFATDSSLDAPHTLVVSARDLAGNEAQRYEAAPFVIDTKAPELSILKRVSADDAFLVGGEASELEDSTAYAQALELVVECEDSTSFSMGGVEASLVGARGGTWEPELELREGGVRLTWPNIGLVQGEDGSSYLVEADDVYTLTAKVVDLAGNETGERSVTFSLNRYGSNFYVEELGDAAEGSSQGGEAPLLAQAPRIVVHEVNVSGASPEGEDATNTHMVTKEHAHTTSEIARTREEQSDGYVLTTPVENQRSAPEGWWEYVYIVGDGNFGKGSDSDLGDGGQGLYRVNVTSLDRAQNLNTTASYWGTASTRTGEAARRSATASFTLDEEGPSVEDVVVPERLWLGEEFVATFRVSDEITNGDTVQVLVDGKRVEVVSEETGEPLDEEGHIAHQGSFSFVVGARSLLQARDVEIRVADYTGLAARTQVVRRGGFCVTTLVPEACAALASLAAVALVRRRVAQGVPPRT